MNILVKETSLKESLKVFNKIPEFDRQEAGTVEYCEKRINNRDCLILSAYANEDNVAYLIAYEKNNCFYCWVAAVVPSFRKLGILSKMMRIYEEYAKKNNYKEITIKTDNSKREMLNYLVKNNWNFVDVITKNDIKDNEIILKKEI